MQTGKKILEEGNKSKEKRASARAEQKNLKMIYECQKETYNANGYNTLENKNRMNEKNRLFREKQSIKTKSIQGKKWN